MGYQTKMNMNDFKITDIIKKKLKKWEDEYKIKPNDINTGDCLIFAESLESDKKKWLFGCRSSHN